MALNNSLPSNVATEPSSNWGFDVKQQPKIDPREKLRQYFLTLKDDEQTKGWDDMWQQEITPWDRHQPNPALLDALSSKKKISESPLRGDKRNVRKKALVPGCGRGYDVLLFASYGFDGQSLAYNPLLRYLTHLTLVSDIVDYMLTSG